MLKITASGQSLGATIEGLDLARPLADEDFATVVRTLGQYGVVRFARAPRIFAWGLTPLPEPQQNV